MKYLNIECTYELVTIPWHLISCFPKLCVLRVTNCGRPLNGSILSGDNEFLVEEFQCLKHLKLLTITITNPIDLQRILGSQKLQSCTQVLSLKFLYGSTSLNISDLENMKHVDLLYITTCTSLEELKMDWKWKGRRIQVPRDLHNPVITRERCFNSLCRVEITNCIELRDLTWLIFAPNLAFLTLSHCFKMEEIINVEKLGEVLEVVRYLQPFTKLEVLELYTLPQLKSIYWNARTFLYLKKINIFCCPGLKKLPLNSNSANERKLVIQADEEWWNDIICTLIHASLLEDERTCVKLHDMIRDMALGIACDYEKVQPFS